MIEGEAMNYAIQRRKLYGPPKSPYAPSTARGCLPLSWHLLYMEFD